MAKRVKIISPPLVQRKSALEKPAEPIKKQKPEGGEIPKANPVHPVVPQPALLSGELVELLKRQKRDGQELLKMGFLPLSRGQQWKALTKDILVKIFTPDPAFTDAILYSGEQQVYSVYEPESLLEKHRRKTLQASLRMLEICMEELGLNEGSSTPELIEKIKGRVTAERKAFLAQSQEEIKKEREASKAPLKLTKAVESQKTQEPQKAAEIQKTAEPQKAPEPQKTVETQKAIIVEEPEEAKEPKAGKEPSGPDMSKGVDNKAAPVDPGTSAAQVHDQRTKAPEVSPEPPKHDMAIALEEEEEEEEAEEEADEEASMRPAPEEEEEEEKKEAKPMAIAIQPDLNKGKESMKTSQGRKVFVVHGNDEEKKDAVAALLARMDLEPVILHEEPGHAMTLIDKFEHYADVIFAVIILTGDDYGYAKGKPEESKPRPKQNVVFELGFLIGRFPGQHVCALHEEGLEMPSDYKGAVFIPHDAGGVWKLLVARAMKTANVEVDLNKAL